LIRKLPLAILLLVGSVAFAQNEFEGLDLTDEKKPEPAPEKPAEPVKPAPVPDRKPVTKANDGPAVERDITQEDRVKSVQRKLYLKRGRFELAPYVMLTVNDPYYSKFGGAIRAAFYPADALAISVRGSYMAVIPSDDVKVAKSVFQSRIFNSVPEWSVMGNFEWSPFYGKVSFFNSILHLDAYVLGGMGIVYAQTSKPTPTNPDRTVKPAADLGLGIRFVAKDFFAVNVALINTAYVDQPVGTDKAGAQNIMAIYAGFSLFIPFKSTYREDE
jgi:outer membrane beta-barrel protein